MKTIMTISNRKCQIKLSVNWREDNTGECMVKETVAMDINLPFVDETSYIKYTTRTLATTTRRHIMKSFTK